MATKGGRIDFMFLAPPLPGRWIRYWMPPVLSFRRYARYWDAVLLPPANEVLGKVIFSQVSFCPQWVGGISQHAMGRGCTPPRQTPPQADTPGHTHTLDTPPWADTPPVEMTIEEDSTDPTWMLSCYYESRHGRSQICESWNSNEGKTKNE